MIRERVLKKERMRLEHEKKMFNTLKSRFEDEERRRNGDTSDGEGERKDSGLGSYSDHTEVCVVHCDIN